MIIVIIYKINKIYSIQLEIIFNRLYLELIKS